MPELSRYSHEEKVLFCFLQRVNGLLSLPETKQSPSLYSNSTSRWQQTVSVHFRVSVSQLYKASPSGSKLKMYLPTDVLCLRCHLIPGLPMHNKILTNKSQPLLPKQKSYMVYLYDGTKYLRPCLLV